MQVVSFTFIPLRAGIFLRLISMFGCVESIILNGVNSSKKLYGPSLWLFYGCAYFLRRIKIRHYNIIRAYGSFMVMFIFYDGLKSVAII